MLTLAHGTRFLLAWSALVGFGSLGGAQGDWVRAGALLPPEGYVGTERHYGWDAALVGDWALVAAPPIDGGSAAGGAYLYEGTGANWRLDREFAVLGGTPQDDFARSLALTMGRAWIGAPGERQGAGAAYLYEHQGADWNLTLRYAPTPGSGQDSLGAALTILGDTALVGAPGDGAVHVLERGGGTWQPTAILRPSEAGGEEDFGRAVLFDGLRAFVGAPGAGAVYVYLHDGQTWSLEARLQPAGLTQDFGASLAVEGVTLVVGAPKDEGEGRAYVFERAPTGWFQTGVLAPNEISPSHDFGASVSVLRRTVAVGAPGEGADFGTLHVFERTPQGWLPRQRFQADPQPGDGRFAYHVALGRHTLLGNFGLNDTGVISYVGALYVWSSEPVVRWAPVPGTLPQVPGLTPGGAHPGAALEVAAGPRHAGDGYVLFVRPVHPAATSLPDPASWLPLPGTTVVSGVLDSQGVGRFALDRPAQSDTRVNVVGWVREGSTGRFVPVSGLTGTVSPR